MKIHELIKAYNDGETIEWRSTGDYWSEVSIESWSLKNIINYVEVGFLRIKPKTININGLEINEPVREEPKDGDALYIVSLKVREFIWSGSLSDRVHLKCGLLHRDRLDATKHVNALTSLTMKKDDEI